MAIQQILLYIGLLVLSGCGSNNTPTTVTNVNTTVSTIQGTANLGIVNGASVSAYQFINGTTATQLGTTQITTSTGKFSINIGTYTGLVMLVLSNPNSSATYIDEAKGKNIPMGANAFRALVSAPINISVSITPLTEIITDATIRKITAGATAQFAMAESAAQIGAAFINQAHPLYTTPMDIAAASIGTANSESYASSLAGLAIVAAAGNKDLFTVAKTYANILFPTGTTTGNFTVAQLNELRSASLNYNGNALGLNTPQTIATPTGSVNLGSTALNKTYFYLYQNLGGNLATTPNDMIETGQLNAAIPNSNLIPIERWHITPTVSATQQALPAVVLNAGTTTTTAGTVSIAASLSQHMTLHTASQGGVLAGSVMQTNFNSHEWGFAVQKPVTPITANAIAANYQLISMGKNTIGSFTQDGTLTLNANLTVSLTENRTNVGTTKPISQTQNYIYTILPDDRITIALPSGTQIQILFENRLQYGLISFINPTTGTYSTGFIIRQHNNTPYMVGHNYHYAAMTAVGTQFSSENGVAFLNGLKQITGSGTQFITTSGIFSSLKNTTLTGTLAAPVGGKTSLQFNQKTWPALYSSNGDIIVSHDPGNTLMLFIRQ